MKKIYIAPAQIACTLSSEKVISSSTDITSSTGGVNVTYGGTDTGGSLNPDVKVNVNVWDEEW